MKNIFITLSLVFINISISSSQLAINRIQDIADIKVERFELILDLTNAQSAQLRKQTIIMLQAQGAAGESKEMMSLFQKNLDKYYESLTLLQPQQLATLKLMDSMEKDSRRASYTDMMEAFGQSSEFGVAVATYNWNVALPILVSYRKDLDRYITPTDKALIAELREELITKYNFITLAQATDSSIQTKVIISNIQDEIINDINETMLPNLIRKYDERIVEARVNLAVHEKKIKKDIQALFNQYVGEKYSDQKVTEQDFIGLIGISKLMRDSFFLLLDGDSRSNSFKINALHLMAIGVAVNNQF